MRLWTNFFHLPWPLNNMWRASWGLFGLVLLLLSVGLLLIFTLANSTSNQAQYEQYYDLLLILNVAVVVSLLATLLWAGMRLTRGVLREQFGSRLWLKLSLIFTAVAVFSGGLVYTVSYQFVSRSIESWFDVRVEGALSAGLNLGRNLLEDQSQAVERKTSALLNDLSVRGTVDAIALTPKQLQDQYGLSGFLLWKHDKVLAQVGSSPLDLRSLVSSLQQQTAANESKPLLQVEGLGGGHVAQDAAPARIEAIARFWPSAKTEAEYLITVALLDPVLVKNALEVQSAYREYQERSLVRQGLRRMYIGTLSLTLLLAILLAIFLAYLMGRQLVQPLLLLAKGVQQVAQGDLQPKTTSLAKDELGGLTRSFAAMTQQLLEARQNAQNSMAALDLERHRVQTILDNLTAAVLLLDDDGRLILANSSAGQVLSVDFSKQQGRGLAQIVGMEVLGEELQKAFADWQALESGQEPMPAYWQKTFERSANTILMARGTRMGPTELLLVLDDISEVVSAERIQTWAEVARRLAHEIKNPLTPIQLSAERLEQKLLSKLAEPEQGFLLKSINTIVVQVKAMQRLVNEFRDFGRLPAADLKPLSLNALVREVLSLYNNSVVPIKVDLEPQDLWVEGDAQQLRQVIHNLLLNAQDACEAAPVRGEVLIQTRASQDKTQMQLNIQDNGQGFSEAVMKRAFEPYVTTKAKGTGLGLAVVKKIADEHGSQISLVNIQKSNEILGAQVRLTFKTSVFTSRLMTG